MNSLKKMLAISIIASSICFMPTTTSAESLKWKVLKTGGKVVGTILVGVGKAVAEEYGNYKARKEIERRKNESSNNY